MHLRALLAFSRNWFKPRGKPLRRRHIKAYPVECPAFTAVVLLHVDDKNSSVSRVNFDLQPLQVHDFSALLLLLLLITRVVIGT